MALERRYRFAMSLTIASTRTELFTTRNPWVLASRGLTVFYGCPEMPRLSHYFLPRLLFAKKQILYLDGANQVSPLLLARFARERGVEPSTVNSLIRVARAFTCFQLTELVRRVPKTLEKFPADVLIVTALPDLYFDEDVRDRELDRCVADLVNSFQIRTEFNFDVLAFVLETHPPQIVIPKKFVSGS
jgi:hypothetical protein